MAQYLLRFFQQETNMILCYMDIMTCCTTKIKRFQMKSCSHGKIHDFLVQKEIERKENTEKEQRLQIPQ